MTTRSLLCLTVVVGAYVILGVGWQVCANEKDTEIRLLKEQWNEEKRLLAQANAAQITQAKLKEQALIQGMKLIQQEKANEDKRIAAAHVRELDGLRQRYTQRAGTGGVPEGAQAGVGCTGEGLARGDAEFLVGYAADAARLSAAYAECRAVLSLQDGE